MAGTVQVAADDVRCVSVVLNIAARAFGSALGQVPGFGDALEACGRLEEAARAADLPADPISTPSQVAIVHHEMLAAYLGAGFERDEAFAIVLTYIAANASMSAMRQAHG